MADSNAHASKNLPIVLVGGGMGVKGGRHIKYADDTPLANLHLTLDGHDGGAASISSGTARGGCRSSRSRGSNVIASCDRSVADLVSVVVVIVRSIAGLAPGTAVPPIGRFADQAVRSGAIDRVRELLRTGRGRERAAGRWRDGVALGGPPIGPGGDRAAGPRRRRCQCVPTSSGRRRSGSPA